VWRQWSVQSCFLEMRAFRLKGASFSSAHCWARTSRLSKDNNSPRCTGFSSSCISRWELSGLFLLSRTFWDLVHQPESDLLPPPRLEAFLDSSSKACRRKSDPRPISPWPPSAGDAFQRRGPREGWLAAGLFSKFRLAQKCSVLAWTVTWAVHAI
jgi:hypothetical protein